MRIFLAINWTETTLDAIDKCRLELHNSGVRGHWRQRENMHLTLKFLGEVQPDLVRKIHQVLKEIPENRVEFTVKIAGLGVFPNKWNPRILWLGVESKELNHLQGLVENKLISLGFAPEIRAYRPHITLASGGITGFKADQALPGYFQNVFEEVKTFELMESVVVRGKRVYNVLERY